MSRKTTRAAFLDASTLPRGLAFPPSADVEYLAFESTAPEEVGRRIATATVVITNKVRLGREHLQGASHLKLVAVAAAGSDNIDFDAAKSLGIEIRNVPDYGSDSVAEHAIATLFALRRQLFVYAGAALDGRWQASPHFCWTGLSIRDVGGTVFGVVGRGRIGEAAAKLARGVGMRVLFAQTPGGECKDDELPFDELLAQSDALTLHVPLTPNTKGMLGERTLALMKRDAVRCPIPSGALDPSLFARRQCASHHGADRWKTLKRPANRQC